MTPKSDKSPFNVVKKSKIQKNAVLPTNYTEVPSITTHKYRMKLFFYLLKRVRNFNFQKKLIKKLTQLIFPKIYDNKSCMSANVIILNHFEVNLRFFVDRLARNVHFNTNPIG